MHKEVGSFWKLTQPEVTEAGFENRLPVSGTLFLLREMYP
jgi:hypothetical protein